MRCNPILNVCDTWNNPTKMIFFQNKIDDWIAATDFDSDGKITLEEFKLGMAGNTLVDDV